MSERGEQGTPPEPPPPPPSAPVVPDKSGSGELVLIEEVPGLTAPAPPPTTRRGFRLSDDALEQPPSDSAELADEARQGSSDAVPLPDPATPSLEDQKELSGSGEGALNLLDSSPDDEGGPLPPLAPSTPLGPGPLPGPRPVTPGRPLHRSPSARLSASTPSRPLGRLAEFYGPNDPAPRLERRPSKRLGPLCHACGAKLEGARCGRCGEPASVRAQIEVASAPGPAPPLRLNRSTPQGPLIAAAVRERLAKEDELVASSSQAARQRRRGALLVTLGWGLLQAAIGAGVSLVTTQGWLAGVLVLLDLALGAWAGRRIASGEGSLTGQVSAGGAMAAACAVKVLIAAVNSDLSLVLAVAAAVGASVLAAVLGTALGSKLADPSRAQA